MSIEFKIPQRINNFVLACRWRSFMNDLEETLGDFEPDSKCAEHVQNYLNSNTMVSKVRETGLSVGGFGLILGIVPSTEFQIAAAIIGITGGGVALGANKISHTLDRAVRFLPTQRLRVG